jgi:hypothetical protein
LTELPTKHFIEKRVFGKLSFDNKGATEQINGREGETAILYNLFRLNFGLRGGGFALRHLKR